MGKEGWWREKEGVGCVIWVEVGEAKTRKKKGSDGDRAEREREARAGVCRTSFMGKLDAEQRKWNLGRRRRGRQSKTWCGRIKRRQEMASNTLSWKLVVELEWDQQWRGRESPHGRWRSVAEKVERLKKGRGSGSVRDGGVMLERERGWRERGGVGAGSQASEREGQREQ